MLDYAQLAAVAAVLKSGSFERAARELGLTPSAVSQRVRQIEERVGAVLIVRGQPCVATPAGSRLLRHAEEVALLEAVLDGDLRAAATTCFPTLKIAVNADSLATWFVEALAAAGDYLFDIVTEDQDHSIELLRQGRVRAAVSAFAGAVQGCDRRALGALRYVATASPSFMERWFANGLTPQTLSRAPCLTFDTKDGLQARWLRLATGQDIAAPLHYLPSAQAFIDASAAGLGWGLNPLALVAPLIAKGRLVALQSDLFVDTPLYWHFTRSLGAAIAPVTAAVTAVAARALLPMEPAAYDRR